MKGVWRLEGARRVSLGCLEDTSKVSRMYLEGVWKMFGSTLEGFLKVPERCLEGAWTLSENVFKVCRKY